MAHRHKVHYSIHKEMFTSSAKGILWTILFQRLLGTINPKLKRFLGVSYPCSDIPEVDTLILQNLKKALEAIDNYDKGLSTESSYDSLSQQLGRDSSVGYPSVVIRVQFRKDEKSSMQVSLVDKGREQVESQSDLIQDGSKSGEIWEVWDILFKITPDKVESIAHIEKSFRMTLLKILKLSTESLINVPSIHSDTTYSPFPFEIQVVPIMPTRTAGTTITTKNNHNHNEWIQYFKGFLPESNGR